MMVTKKLTFLSFLLLTTFGGSVTKRGILAADSGVVNTFARLSKSPIIQGIVACFCILNSSVYSLEENKQIRLFENEIYYLEKINQECKQKEDSLDCLLAKIDQKIARMKRVCDTSLYFRDLDILCISAMDDFFDLINIVEKEGNRREAIDRVKKAKKILLKTSRGHLVVDWLDFDERLRQLYAAEEESKIEIINTCS